MKPLVCAIGVSRKDVLIASTWLRWVSLLSGLPGGSCEGRKLIVVCTRNVTAPEWVDLNASVSGNHMFGTQLLFPQDIHESGYPGSASHLFYRTMETCEREHPGHPILWVEADAIPMRPGWFQEVEEEYLTCGKHFMGHLELKINPPHMAGVAVYPPNWRELSPRLNNCHQAPDTRQWGRGKGQAFDVYAAPDILPQAAQARTIQQVWNCPRITETNIEELINPVTALFHQCKTGALIELLSRTKYPRWAQQNAA